MVYQITWILGSLLVGYVLILLLMYFMQSAMVYHPQKTLAANPVAIGLDYEDVKFQTEDGVSLHGWFVPYDSVDTTILYFHGNAGNISGRLETIQLLHQLGLNVLIFDYRGYGQSEGTPSEQGTYNDALAAWKYLEENKGIPKDRIVVMGRSLGGSVAAWLAARKAPAATIVESTFTSAIALGAELYPWLPVRWISKFEYNTLENIQRIDSPLFMAHSRDDEVVPFHHGERLFKTAKEPKTFVELRGSHGTAFLDTGAQYREAMREFLQKHISYQHKKEQ